MRKISSAALFAFVAWAHPVVAQEDPATSGRTARHAAAMSAGSKALYMCSGIFSAGLTPERIQADNLSRGDTLEDAMAGMRTVVNEQEKTVSVFFLPDMPPRIAAWRPALGCTQLPIGAAADAVNHLPRLQVPVPARTDDARWPQGDRDALAPLPDGQATALARVVESAFDGQTYGGVTWGVVVVQNGKIVSERYERGYDMHTPQRTFSAAKSMAATIVGLAVKRKLLDIHAPAPIAEWRRQGDPRAKITVNNLLHMASGLYTERAGDPQGELYYSGAAVAERSAGNIFDSMPGKRWVYAGSDTLLSVRAVRAAIGDDTRFLAFPFEELFWKVGMNRTFPETDWNGDFMMSGQVWSTARDFARFGLLYLNDGVWNGERILPDGWARYVATQAPAQPASADGRGYGAQFWLFGPKQGLPEGAYTPIGARGQFAMIIPSRNVIVVRRGFDTSRGFHVARFAADVLAALAAR